MYTEDTGELKTKKMTITYVALVHRGSEEHENGQLVAQFVQDWADKKIPKESIKFEDM